METRSSILDRAAELLAESPAGDISTRAVCEAAGITQPVLYRLFGDKAGLLSATVDHVWDQYLSMKRAAPHSDDPLHDLYAGWDSHTRFALDHPHAYRLLFGTSLASPPSAGEEAMSILRAHLERLAATGRLRMPPEEASRVVMAANSGIALALVLRPGEYDDDDLSATVRDVVYRSLVTDADPPHGDNTAEVAAVTLQAHLAGEWASADLFSTAERALMGEWLTRITHSAAIRSDPPTTTVSPHPEASPRRS